MSSAVSRLTPQICLSVSNATPIHSLPIELLLAVFTFVDEDEASEGEAPGFLSMNNKRWQLGRVCNWWRRVVEESPSLWTRIDVPLAEASMLRDPAALLHHALRLTKGQGLDLWLNFEMEASAEEGDITTAPAFTATDLFTILVAHVSCWRKVVLTHFDERCWPVISKTVGSTILAKLETLAIIDEDTGEDSDDEDEGGEDAGDEDADNSGDADEDNSSDGGDDSPPEDDHDETYDSDWVPNAPLLKCLFVQNVPLACGPLHPHLKEFVVLDAIYDVSLAYLLQESECLEVLWAEEFNSEFKLPSDGDSDLPIEIPARVKSSSLLHLSLHQSVEDLDTVDLPNLRSLIAGDPLLMGSAAPYLQSIFELVRFSHCPLTRLALLNCDFAVGNLLEILKLLPLLKMLRINFGRIQLDDAFNGNVDRVLSSLTSALGEVDKESEAFTLVPDLEELRVDFYDGTKIASAFEWTFYTPKVEADFGMRRRRNGFTASCTFKGKPYFGVTLPGHCASWISIPAKPQ
ncbi:hypothetical protein BDZ89DRAFT_1167136 [Hymenopellis radicata]|nr:hypothetical protein BDZ89DRAFT_1167136 [Hymenopellis radicata]